MDEHGLFIGLMSGTSLDGVDGVLLQISPRGEQNPRPGTGIRVLQHAHRPFPSALHDTLSALNVAGMDEIHRSQQAAIALAEVYAEAVRALLGAAKFSAGQIRAIGVHGQTVRHRPDCGYTVQIHAPALLVERTGIAVVTDFRSRDIAAGGQGAPLVPAFHRAVFGREGEPLAVLNLGGIANLSLMDVDGSVRGFDCGPANVLLDAWARRHLGTAFDANGAWSAGGAVQDGILQALLADPYFSMPPPKSTGLDYFHLPWLERVLAQHPPSSAQDVQATLAELTAQSVARDLGRWLPDVPSLIVCGGGAGNADLMRRLRQAMPAVDVVDSVDRGMPSQQVEAAAFAWLAAQTLAGLPGNLPAVTGAIGPRVLGAIYPV